jgi:hypothetical protein
MRAAFTVSSTPAENKIMAQSKNQSRHPDHPTEKHTPEYRAKSAPRAEQPRDCHTVRPPAAPSSAAENHDAAHQKCAVKPPQTASNDEREKSTG